MHHNAATITVCIDADGQCQWPNVHHASMNTGKDEKIDKGVSMSTRACRQRTKPASASAIQCTRQTLSRRHAVSASCCLRAGVCLHEKGKRSSRSGAALPQAASNVSS